MSRMVHRNCFDFFVVMTGLIEYMGVQVSGVVVLRLVRLMRIFRLVKSLPRLKSVVESLVAGFSTVGWVVIMIAVFNYIFACMGMIIFKANDPFHFGTLSIALLTVYRIETLDTWDQILRVNL